LDIPRKRESLHVREIDGELVVLDPENERMHTLNPTAAFIFDAVDGQRTREEIWKRVAAHFEIDPDTAERDTREVLRQFSELELITGLTGAAPSEVPDSEVAGDEES
jgi:hypothetical protein